MFEWLKVLKSMEQDMGVTVQIDTPLATLMEKLGCDSNLMLAVVDASLKAEYSISGVIVTVSDSTLIKLPNSLTQKPSATAPVKLGVLESILSGTAGPGTKAMAKQGVEKAVKLVLGEIAFPIPKSAFLKSAADLKHGEEPFIMEMEIPPETLKTDDVADLSTLFKSEKAKIEPVGPSVKKEDKVPLSQATKLYQKVFGTSPSSTYYAIALGTQVNVAARMMGLSKISIRVEGQGVKYIKEKLKAVGFDSSNDHYSLHLVANTKELARKSVGAVVFGLGIPFDKVATDLEGIWGLGA